jgi:hypothetical protein
VAFGAAAQVSDPSHGLRAHRTPGLPSGHGSPPGAAVRSAVQLSSGYAVSGSTGKVVSCGI